MSVNENIKKRVQRIQRGEPFTNSSFLKLGSRPAVDKALSRLVQENVIIRITRGVFMRPKQNRFIGDVAPDISRVIEVMAKDHGETVQVHGAEAARRFKLSTQMPTTTVFYTSGPSRELRVGNLTARLIHTSSRRKFQHAGKKPGLALTALWYLGKENVNSEAIEHIREGLSENEFETLRSCKMPAWMSSAINTHNSELVNG